MILVIWEYSTDKLSLIATGAVLSSAIQIDPVNIKQINATKIHDAAMSQMENCWLGCVTSQHIVCRIFLKFHLTWICGWMRKYGKSCVELAALCSGPWWIWSCSSSSRLDILLWEISAIASSGYLFYLSKKKKLPKINSNYVFE